MIKKLGLFVSPFILATAILLRLVLAGTTFHVDLNALVLASNFINRGEVFTFYDHVRRLPVGDPIKSLYTDKIFNYQPLSYLVPSLFYLPFKSVLDPVSQALVRDSRNLLSVSRPFEPILILYKLPYIFFDLLCAFFITRLAKDLKAKKRLQLLWLFNPVAIFVSTFMAQTDMMVIFFLLAAMISAHEEKPWRAAIFAGLSALFKPVGLFVVPVIAAYYVAASFSKGIRVFFLGIGTYLLGILPYLPSVSFRMYALLAEQTGKSTFAGITIASGTTIPWFFIAYTVILILLLKRRLTLIDGIGLALASSLVFSHFHPQWFVWLTPWLIYRTLTGKIYFYLAALVSWFIILLSFDYSLHFASFWWLGFVSNQYLFAGNQIWQNLVLLSRAFLISISFLTPWAEE